MSDHQFYLAWGECYNYTDRDAYISDILLSSVWNDDEGDDIPQDRIDQLIRIWDVQHMSMRDLRTASGLSQIKYAERFCIPRRTVQDWDADKRTPPEYVKLLLAKSIGLI